jgi:UPF0176 protein
MNRYLVLSYYNIFPLSDLQRELLRHKEFFEGRDVKGRIYITPQGINAQMSGAQEEVEAYMEWLRADSRFDNVNFNLQWHHENVFPRMTVKMRPQLVALDVEVDFDKRGEHVSPKQWREMLEGDESYLQLDVRNDYEWDVGHFKGFERPTGKTFRDFVDYARQLKEQHNPKKTKVMMCCTGGIRCELYSALLKEEGFDEVYQLKGGIIKYGNEEQGKHWKGKLFVFDDRLTADVGPESETVVGKCHHCEAATDNYYNCSNMDCNELFLCCPECLQQYDGCCQVACKTAPRLRPYHHQDPHKPFRKWYHYFKEKENLP